MTYQAGPFVAGWSSINFAFRLEFIANDMWESDRHNPDFHGLIYFKRGRDESPAPVIRCTHNRLAESYSWHNIGIQHTYLSYLQSVEYDSALDHTKATYKSEEVRDWMGGPLDFATPLGGGDWPSINTDSTTKKYKLAIFGSNTHGYYYRGDSGAKSSLYD